MERLLLALTVAYTLAVLLGAGLAARALTQFLVGLARGLPATTLAVCPP